MIVGSLLLILVAVGLLVAGVLSSSNVLIIASIVATVIAAIVLILGVRQSANGADDEEDYDVESDEADTSGGFETGGSRRDTPSDARSHPDRSSDRGDGLTAGAGATPRGGTITDEAVASVIPSQGGSRLESAPDLAGSDAADEFDAPAQFAAAESVAAESIGAESIGAESIADMDEDPPDEPSAEMTTPTNAARIAMLASEVLVIDGRPRYHVLGCVHLLGRESEPLPVGEALELGFSPCGMCEPDSALLAEARRV